MNLMPDVMFLPRACLKAINLYNIFFSFMTVLSDFLMELIRF